MNDDTIFFSVKIQEFRGLLICLQDRKHVHKARYSRRMENEDDKNYAKNAWIDIVEVLSSIEGWLMSQYQFPNWIIFNRPTMHRNSVVNYSLMLDQLASTCSSIYSCYSSDDMDFINYESMDAFASANPMAHKWNSMEQEIKYLITQLADNYYVVDWQINFPEARNRNEYFNQKDQYEDQRSNAEMDDIAEDGLNEFYEGFDREYLGED